MYTEITQAKYFKVFSENKPNLCPHSSFTDMDGTSPLGNGGPQVITEWGLRDSDTPLIKVHSEEVDGKMQHNYYFYKTLLGA
jgi:hypothetical protein|tara:strand:+ start:444 stop:689 length:246 start_codon:yes stop_codon:yes gene_type:complete